MSVNLSSALLKYWSGGVAAASLSARLESEVRCIPSSTAIHIHILSPFVVQALAITVCYNLCHIVPPRLRYSAIVTIVILTVVYLWGRRWDRLVLG